MSLAALGAHEFNGRNKLHGRRKQDERVFVKKAARLFPDQSDESAANRGPRAQAARSCQSSTFNCTRVFPP